ncbi:MAG: hypothetical protein GY832_07185 [Chloroflexi bacterium]|nr:hypothetical protein [Chloroflexota bacterium]
MDAIPTPVFLIIALAFLALAGGIGFWLYNYATGGSLESSTRERSATAGPLPENELSIPASGQEMLSVHRLERGELAVFVRGQRYYHLRGIQEAQLGIDAVEAVVHVMSFAEGWIPTLQKTQSQPAPKSMVDQEAFLEQLRQSDLFPQEKSSPGMFSGLGRRSSKESSPLITPADAINELVRKRVQEQPDMVKRDIRIMTNPNGSLCFRVGLHTFEKADDISDPQVKALVQDAIREWREI